MIASSWYRIKHMAEENFNPNNYYEELGNFIREILLDNILATLRNY